MAELKHFELIMEVEPYCLYNEETGEVCMQISQKQELVRCLNCIYYSSYDCCNNDMPICGDDATRFMPPPDFYCAYGEMRKE